MEQNRREFLKTIGLTTAALTFGNISFAVAKSDRPNILLITADDMNFDSVGVYGCKIKDITPNMDKLASEGMLFNNAHVTVAVCQPCRGVLMTGRYPHRSGIEGFNHIDNSNVPLLTEELKRAGYLNGILGKVSHSSPKEEFEWDMVQYQNDLGQGRDPEKYYSYSKKYFEEAKRKQRPFFLMANSHDPHRPFAGSKQEKKTFKTDIPEFSREIKPEEVEVPEFLPDIINVRKEVAQYFTSVHRCDQTIGAVLKALDESGLRNSTIVIFLSDHGMAFPFAKTNCYLQSTKTPWIVRWPGKIKSGEKDQNHLISSIDLMPTLLDGVDLNHPKGMDGRSFLPILKGDQQDNREYVFTQFHETSEKRRFPMRCVQSKKFGYIFNPWHDVETIFKNESQNGLTFKAMREEAKTNPDVAERVKLFLHRVQEEFYDLENDQASLNNLIDNPEYEDEINEFRTILLNWMEETGDSAMEALQQRDNSSKREEFMEQQTRGKRPVPGVLIKHKALGGLVTFEHEYSVRYSGGSHNALTDGIRAPQEMGEVPNHKYWQGFEGVNLDATIKFREIRNIKFISAGFLQDKDDWIFLPKTVEFFVSADGVKFQKVAEINNDVQKKKSGLIYKLFFKEIEPVHAKFIQVTAQNIGICPNWHPGAGGKAWIFVDEIIVE